LQILACFSAIILTMILKRLVTAFLLLIVVFLLGISGYMLIERWNFLDSLYMTVITIASVGYMEVNPLSAQGRIFTIFLIIFGMGVLLFGISTFTAFLVEGELNALLRRKKMEKQILKLRGHYIVCGIGRLGKHIMNELFNTKRDFVAIDTNEAVCKELGEKGILYVQGDATSGAILKVANAEQAKGLFCALSADAENLLLILTAKGINPHMKVISKAEVDESREKMIKAGANGVVLPLHIGGLRMASEMIRPEAVTFLDKMLKSPEEIYRVEDMIVSADSVLCGKNLKTSGLLDEKGLSIAAIRKGDKYIFNPPVDEILDIGDALILIGETARIRAIKKIAG